MLTAIVPLYNEGSFIREFHNKLVEQETIDVIIYIDDGSIDDTLMELRRLSSAASTTSVQYLSLGRNFGKEIALLCGFDHCDKQSDVVVLDGDGQHPVSEISRMYEYLDNNTDAVFAVRSDRSYQTFIQRFLSNVYYSSLSVVNGIKIDNEIGDFFCARAHYIKALRLYRSSSLFLKCIYPDMGFRIYKFPVKYTADLRTSRFSHHKKISIASTSILYLSGAPLRIIAPIGILVSCFSAMALLVVLAQYILRISNPPGYLTLVFLINFYNGLIIVILGVVARYLELILRDALGKPIYTIKEHSDQMIT